MISADRYALKKQRALHCYTALPAPCSVCNPELLWQLFIDIPIGIYDRHRYLCRYRERERGGGTEKLYLSNTALHKVRKHSSYTQRALQTTSQLHCNLHLGRRISSPHCMLEWRAKAPLPFKEGLNTFYNTTQDLSFVQKQNIK